MTVQPHSPHRTKTLAEGAMCFACAISLLLAAALATQWLFDFIV